MHKNNTIFLQFFIAAVINDHFVCRNGFINEKLLLVLLLFLCVSFYVEKIFFEGKILYAINVRRIINQKYKCFLWATKFKGNYFNKLKEMVDEAQFLSCKIDSLV